MNVTSLILGLLLGAGAAAALLLAPLLRARERARATASELALEASARAEERGRHEQELARLDAHHREQLEGARQQVALVQANRVQLRDELKAISADVLKSTGESLAERLREQRRAEQERASGEMARRTEEIKGLVRPVEEKLGRVESELARVERERRQSQGQLAEVLRQLQEGVGGLRAETGSLVSALKRPSTRGSWGEIQLRNVIEMAGMIEHCDFVEQATIRTDEGMLRPDVLVRLPGGKLIVVDAKVPLDAYLAHLEARSDDERDLELARHARQTREHVMKLASKGYQRQFGTALDSVVMFVPSDGIYQAALAQDPSLIESGIQQNVLLASPTTLIALLRAMHFGWRQEQIAESARELAHAGRELHHRLGTFVEHLAKVGRRLDSALGAYNDAVGSFDRSVVPQVRRIERAGAQSDRELEAPAPVETAVRRVNARGVERQGGDPRGPVQDALDAPPALVPAGHSEGAPAAPAVASAQPALGSAPAGADDEAARATAA
jgi:DNA recombination protein RmuC